MDVATLGIEVTQAINEAFRIPQRPSKGTLLDKYRLRLATQNPSRLRTAQFCKSIQDSLCVIRSTARQALKHFILW